MSFHAVWTRRYIEMPGVRFSSATAARMPDAAVEDFADGLIYP
jgi:hypothetical protein